VAVNYKGIVLKHYSLLKKYQNNAVTYCHILTLEKEGEAVNYYNDICITLAPVACIVNL
jgi:hypothetical protein